MLGLLTYLASSNEISLTGCVCFAEPTLTDVVKLNSLSSTETCLMYMHYACQLLMSMQLYQSFQHLFHMGDTENVQFKGLTVHIVS